MQLFYCPEILQGNTFLNPEESRHCVKVLRKNTGDYINITDGSGHMFECILDEINQKKCTFHINSQSTIQKPVFSVHIAISPTKNSDRIEWFVEKSVEIGIQKISFIQTSFSERKNINTERIQKKVISAMKQSGRTFMPEIFSMTSLSSFLNSVEADQKFVAHLEDSKTEHLINLAKPNKNYLVIIGPEGGFSDLEINILKDKDYIIAKIGDYRLRTETAGVAVCAILNDINHIK